MSSLWINPSNNPIPPRTLLPLSALKGAGAVLPEFPGSGFHQAQRLVPFFF